MLKSESTYIEMAKLLRMVLILLFTLFVRQGEFLRCWACSSDLNPLCNDPFFQNQTHFGPINLVNCDIGTQYPYLTNSKSFCKKQKKIIQGNPVTIRGCTWKRQDDYTSKCPFNAYGPNEITTYCETCDYDGCNGA